MPSQSLRHRRRFDVHLEIDDEPVIVLRLPMMGADTAGCLSILTPVGLGSYGGHIRAVLLRLGRGKGAHRLNLTLDPKGSTRRIVLFGPRLGRAPVGPRIRIRRSNSSRLPVLLGSHSSHRGR